MAALVKLRSPFQVIWNGTVLLPVCEFEIEMYSYLRKNLGDDSIEKGPYKNRQSNRSKRTNKRSKENIIYDSVKNTAFLFC